MPRRVVIIGTGAAGGSAAFAARRTDRKVEIIAIDKSPRPTYSRCGLPFVIDGTIPSFENLTVLSHGMYRQQKISVLTETEVRNINPKARKLHVSGPQGDEELSYDALIIATGGKASVPKIEGTSLPSVYVLRTAEDGEKILAATATARCAVVNGASFIALEVAEALKKRGLKVYLVVRSRALRSMIDPDLSTVVHKCLQENGIDVLLGNPVSSIGGPDRVQKVIVGDREIPTDMVVIATGTQPEVTLAKDAGIAIGETGGIRVDERLMTNVDGIYAAGDCAESTCAITGRPLLTGLGTIATRQGVVAGINAAGGNQTAPPVLSAAVMRLFGLEIGSVGLTEARANDNGISVAAQTLTYPSLPHYYPGGQDIRVRLLFNKETSQLVGAQFISAVPLAPRINAMSLAIQKRMTARELSHADFCYSPPCADIWDPVAVCAQVVEKKLARNNAT